MRRIIPLVLTLLPAAAPSEELRHFDVVAWFVPAKKPGATASVAVSFRALDPAVRLNKQPPARLNLELTQRVLVDKQAASNARASEYDPLTAEYHDLSQPLLFPVAISPQAPPGEQLVRGNIVFFYCSESEAWCRRGNAEIEIPVSVR